MSENGKRACKATTKAGIPCRTTPLLGADFCMAHGPANVRESSGFIASNGKAGRKKKPTPTEALRERVESQIDKWLAPFEQGLTAERALVVGTGPKARIETVPDIPTRIKAAESGLDRVYGRAKRQVDVADVTQQRVAEMSEEEITAKLLEIDPGFAEVLELEKGDSA